MAQERPGIQREELQDEPLSPVVIRDRPHKQGVGEERPAEHAAELGKIFWERFADLVGDLHNRLSSVAGFHRRDEHNDDTTRTATLALAGTEEFQSPSGTPPTCTSWAALQVLSGPEQGLFGAPPVDGAVGIRSSGSSRSRPDRGQSDGSRRGPVGRACIGLSPAPPRHATSERDHEFAAGLKCAIKREVGEMSPVPGPKNTDSQRATPGRDRPVMTLASLSLLGRVALRRERSLRC